MRIRIVAAAAAGALLLPAMALAQQTCEQRQANRAAGAVVGAGVGALAGSAVAGRGDRTEGAVIGGLAGALLGTQLSKGSQTDCAHAYGYYDSSGAWHATAVSRNNAKGYFDRNGQWIVGAPRGHYDRDGQWVELTDDAFAAGFYDSRGGWVPASAGGYYASDGQWVTAASPGYYDRSGRWIAGPVSGRYDRNGRWISGQPSGRMVNGAWVADPQPGYYQNGRWVRGETMGYYDARGRWVSTDGRSMRTTSEAFEASGGIDARVARLEQRIRRGVDEGSLNRGEADDAMRTLDGIRRDDRALRTREGELRPRDEEMLGARLDQLADSLGAVRRERDRY